MGVRVGKCSSGSPIMFRTIRNLSGNSPITGRTFNATGLYLFFADRLIALIGRIILRSTSSAVSASASHFAASFAQLAIAGSS